MIEYAELACPQETCSMHGEVQYRAWERSGYTHRKVVWVDKPYCEACSRLLQDYIAVHQDMHPDGYTPPMINMYCHNHRCERYGMTYMQAFDVMYRGATHMPHYQGDNGKCPTCNTPMMEPSEWVASRHYQDAHG